MKVLCPRHEDTTPSCELYPDHGWCFVCNTAIPLTELGEEGLRLAIPKPKEDLEQKNAYISKLPIREYRGFPLPHDSEGVYICWPDSLYYKLRLSDPDARCRYLGPSGHKAPLFWARKRNSKTLFIVEGEFEALSVALTFPEYDVVSPGGTGNFLHKDGLTQYLTYANIIIAVDDDQAGRKAGRELGSLLLYRVPFLSLITKSLENDFNDILVTLGKEKLREHIKERMQEGLSWAHHE